MNYLQLIHDAWSLKFDHTEYIQYAEAVNAKADIRGEHPIHTVSEHVYNLITEGLEFDMRMNMSTLQPINPMNIPVGVPYQDGPFEMINLTEPVQCVLGQPKLGDPVADCINKGFPS